jgi:hypothetical protein
LPSAGVNALQVEHDLRGRVNSWDLAISYGWGMVNSSGVQDLAGG